MIPMLAELARRREALRARSSAQREALAQAAAPFTGKLATLDRVTQALRSHPVVAGLAVGALALLGPRRLLNWALRALSMAALVRRVI